MVFVDGPDPLDLACWRSFKIAPDLGMQGRLVVLDLQQVVGLGLKERLGDGGVAAPMASIETRAPVRSRRSTRAGMAVISFDFSSVASCPSTSRLVVAKAETRWKGLVAGLAVMAAARGFAIDRHQLELVRPALCDPGRETVHEQRGINPVHHCAQPIGAGNAKVEL